jgi:hypothetical protein
MKTKFFEFDKRWETYKLASTAPFGSNWRESEIFVKAISVTPMSTPSAEGRPNTYALAPEDSESETTE